MIEINPLSLNTLGALGVAIKGIRSGTLSFSSVGVGANSYATTTATLTGVAVGDIILHQIISGFGGAAQVVSIYPSSSNTLTAVIQNGDIQAATSIPAFTVQYLWFDIT